MKQGASYLKLVHGMAVSAVHKGVLIGYDHGENELFPCQPYAEDGIWKGTH